MRTARRAPHAAPPDRGGSWPSAVTVAASLVGITLWAGWGRPLRIACAVAHTDADPVHELRRVGVLAGVLSRWPADRVRLGWARPQQPRRVRAVSRRRAGQAHDASGRGSRAGLLTRRTVDCVRHGTRKARCSCRGPEDQYARSVPWAMPGWPSRLTGAPSSRRIQRRRRAGSHPARRRPAARPDTSAAWRRGRRAGLLARRLATRLPSHAGPRRADIWEADASGATPRRLTYDDRSLENVVWSRDGRTLIFGSTRGGARRLWRVDRTSGDWNCLPTPALVPRSRPSPRVSRNWRS